MWWIFQKEKDFLVFPHMFERLQLSRKKHPNFLTRLRDTKSSLKTKKFTAVKLEASRFKT